MIKVTCKEDYANAPKKLLLRDFNIAFGKGDVNNICSHLSDDIVW